MKNFSNYTDYDKKIIYILNPKRYMGRSEQNR